MTYRHKKRGTEYELLGFGKMQAERWVEWSNGETDSVDMREVAVYRSVDDGSMWVRPREEFEDGRFEAVTSPPKAEAGEAEPFAWYLTGIDGRMSQASDRIGDRDAWLSIGYVVKPLYATPEPRGDMRVIDEIVEAARMARTRLMAFADAANAGHAQAGGRELARKVWGAFAEFDALDAAIAKHGEPGTPEQALDNARSLQRKAEFHSRVLEAQNTVLRRQLEEARRMARTRGGS